MTAPHLSHIRTINLSQPARSILACIVYTVTANMTTADSLNAPYVVAKLDRTEDVLADHSLDHALDFISWMDQSNRQSVRRMIHALPSSPWREELTDAFIQLSVRGHIKGDTQ